MSSEQQKAASSMFVKGSASELMNVDWSQTPLGGVLCVRGNYQTCSQSTVSTQTGSANCRGSLPTVPECDRSVSAEVAGVANA